MNDKQLNDLLGSLRSQSYPMYETIEYLVERVCEVLKLEEPILSLDTPIIIVGDLLGSFEDLMTIFELNGEPPLASYLFLGNYVDYGSNSLFVFLYLLTLKSLFPLQVFLETLSLLKYESVCF